MQTLLRDKNICLALVSDGRHNLVSLKWLIWQNTEYKVCHLSMLYSERRGIKKVPSPSMSAPCTPQAAPMARWTYSSKSTLNPSPLPSSSSPIDWQPDVLHVYLNAAFARAEQQALRLWRGKPVGVTPIASPGGCIISPSYELKASGVKTAMRIRDARLLSPNLILKQSNPPLYREVHRRFCKIFRDYSPDVVPKSIDEAVIFLHGTPALKTRTMEDIGMEIKSRVSGACSRMRRWQRTEG